MKKFRGMFVRAVKNVTVVEPKGFAKHWLVEFTGPDGLRYVATWFDAQRVAVVCMPAPMRYMAPQQFLAELQKVITEYNADLRAWREAQKAKPDATPKPEPGGADDAMIEDSTEEA